MGVNEVWREKRTSSRTGKDYWVLCTEFENGYKLETFLTNEQVYILADVPIK